MSESDELLCKLLDAMLYIARKEMKRVEEMNWNEMKKFQDMYLGRDGIILADSPTVAACPVSPAKKAPETKMGKPMRYNSHCSCDYCDDGDCEYGRPANDNQRKLNYSGGRIYAIWDRKNDELRKQFFLDEIKPSSLEDMIERIKAGTYSVQSEEFQNERTWWDKWDFIIWRTADEQKDQVGYDKARKALDAAKIKAEDAANLLSSEAAAAAISAFEGWTYEGNSQAG